MSQSSVLQMPEDLDRAGKVLSSIALMPAIAATGVSITISLTIAFAALVAWTASAAALGRAYVKTISSTSDVARPPQVPQPSQVAVADLAEHARPHG